MNDDADHEAIIRLNEAERQALRDMADMQARMKAMEATIRWLVTLVWSGVIAFGAMVAAPYITALQNMMSGGTL